jgi:branched-chain amino acid transport system permease protein
MVEAEGVPLGVSARAPRSLLRALWPVAATAGLLALVPLWLGDSRLMMGLAVDALVFGAYAIGFNVIFGSTNQLFLCMGALAGIGGYASAVLSDTVGIPMGAALLVATSMSAVQGGILSWVAVRRSLTVIFTGIVTLVFALSFQNFVLGQRDLTGGETGFRVSAGADTFLRDRIGAYFAFLGLIVLFLVIFRLIQRSHVGWAFRALRDDELAAELAGVGVARYRIYAGVVGGAIVGLTGALYAHSEGFIGPSTFAFGHVDVRVIVMLAFGGLGTLLGPVVGTGVFAVLDELLVDFNQLREVVYGLLIIVLFLGFKRGAVPAVLDFLRRLVSWVRKVAGRDARSERSRNGAGASGSSDLDG